MMHDLPTIRSPWLRGLVLGLGMGLGVLSATVAVATETPSVELQPLGAFHHDEVRIESGSKWLALLPASGEGRARLVTVTAQVETVFDPVLDDDGEATGKLVSVPETDREPLFLVRGARALRVGPVVEVGPLPMPEQWARFGWWRFELGGRQIALGFQLDGQLDRAEAAGRGGPAADGEPRWTGALILRVGQREQRLVELDLWHDGDVADALNLVDLPHLLWAGDLDGDGELDLYLDMSTSYNAERPTLFLSTAAAPGALVAPVASHEAYGC